MTKIKKLISLILALMIVMTSTVVFIPVYADTTCNHEYDDTLTKINIHYVVADVDTSEFYKNSEYQWSGMFRDDEDRHAYNFITEQNEYEKELCNKIKSGEVKTYTVPEYFKLKNSQSQFKITEDKLQKLIDNNCADYSTYAKYNTKWNLKCKYIDANAFWNIIGEDGKNIGGEWHTVTTKDGKDSCFVNIGVFYNNITEYDNISYRYGDLYYNLKGENTCHITLNSHTQDVYVLLVSGIEIYDHSLLAVPDDYNYNDYDSDYDKYSIYKEQINAYDSDEHYKLKTKESAEEYVDNLIKYYKYDKNNILMYYDYGYDEYGIEIKDLICNKFDDAVISVPDVEGYLQTGKYRIWGYNQVDNMSYYQDKQLHIAPIFLLDEDTNYYFYEPHILTYYDTIHKYTIRFTDENNNPVEVNLKNFVLATKYNNNQYSPFYQYAFYSDAEQSSIDEDLYCSKIVSDNRKNLYYDKEDNLIYQENDNVEYYYGLNKGCDIVTTIGKNGIENIPNTKFLSIEQSNTNDEFILNNDNYELKSVIEDYDTTLTVKLSVLSNVIVNYIDTDGNKISDSDIIPVYSGEDYSTIPKDITDYDLIQMPENASGTASSQGTIVNYVYRSLVAKIIVNYIDTNGNKLAESVVLPSRMFDEYSTEELDIEGYVLTRRPENANGLCYDNTVEVNYVYDVVPVVEPEPTPIPVPETPTEQDKPKPVPENPVEQEQNIEPPIEPVDKVYDTGDNSITVLCVCSIALIGTMVLLIIIKKRRDKNDTHNEGN